MGVEIPVRLRSIEAYLATAHGGPRELSVGELDIIIAHADAVVSEIEDVWPVDTSTSRDAWTFYLDAKSGHISYVIENDADYVQYIHYAGTDPSETLIDTLVPDIIKEDAAGLNADLRAEIDKTERAITAAAKARAAAPRGTKTQFPTLNKLLSMVLK